MGGAIQGLLYKEHFIFNVKFDVWVMLSLFFKEEKLKFKERICNLF